MKGSESLKTKQKYMDTELNESTVLHVESEEGQPPSNYVNASYIHNIYGIR